jgi:tRNA modification GTPase
MSETIVAIATPPGRSAIACIRLSGDEALEIVNKLILPKDLVIKSWTMKHCILIEPKSCRKLDDVIIAYMKKPKSYTGEDMIEIYCHGGMAIVKSIFEALVIVGAKPAEAGEFTKRAFLNGKMDLIQAEAIDEVTRAETKEELFNLNKNLFGFLSAQINAILSKIIRIKSWIEAKISFPDDTIEEDINIEEALSEALNEINEIFEKSGDIERMLYGYRVTIIGKTNVGKSSIFNAIIGWNRMIVSPSPSTTHDYVEETVEIFGEKIKLVDTAGSVENPTELDLIFTQKTYEILERSNLILLVVDMTDYSEIDDEIIKKYLNSNTIIVINKADLSSKIPPKLLKLIGKNYIIVSAQNGEGISKLKEVIAVEAKKDSNRDKELFINERQKGILLRAKEILRNILLIENKENHLDILAFELDKAINALSEEIGLNISGEVFSSIFKNFCIGK